MHPDTEVKFISNEVGHGIVATKRIPKGTITWVQDELDQVYTPEQVSKMKPSTLEMIDKYTFRNSKGNYVMCWDISKYVNHSFKSNCLSTAYDFEIAIRDIEVGEELTDDYGYLNVSEAFEAIDEGTSRTKVYPDDLVNFHKEWDEQLKNAFQHIEKVNQPLQKLLTSETKNKINLISKGQKEMDSILNLYFQENA
jgi:hypothetical protein